MLKSRTDLPKFIFVTGGVVSSVGKGIATASIGRILKARDIAVTIQKLDPYLNVDPGTMSPYQHGEVFVTIDGAETDLDLGHYERFIDRDLTTTSSVTSGQVYSSVLERERRGDYLGGTIQAVPHLTNEIKHRIRQAAEQSDADVIICEVGGTVGDIEGQTFIEAIRQLRHEQPASFLNVHVTFLPYIGATGELKTKPTQHSVRELRSLGIQPDVIIARTDHDVSRDTLDKIADFCDVDRQAVIPLETAPSIYDVPTLLEERGLGDYITERIGFGIIPNTLSEWQKVVSRQRPAKASLSLAIVGKYIELQDAYLSVKEALTHASVNQSVEIDIQWIQAERLETVPAATILKHCDGLIVPGGFGERGWEGKIQALQYAREKQIPTLGLCLGLQAMVTEFARNVCGLKDANSTEFSPTTPYPVISLLEEQEAISNKGGTMRLGAYPCELIAGSHANKSYDTSMVQERHRHRWEVNLKYRDELESKGLLISGVSPDGTLAEIVEIKDHPFFIGTQFHPELQSRPNRPHPLFITFIETAYLLTETSKSTSDTAT